MRKAMRFAVLALLILGWGVSLVTAQTPVTRPAISEEISPVQEFSVETPDGPPAVGVLRRPPGRGPFPAVVIPYPFPLSRWENMALQNATMNRFLAAGYVTVMHAAPDRREGFPAPGPVARASVLAMVNHVKNMSDVDSRSVVLYGCSLGGYLVLQVAADTEVAAITAEEPGGFGYSSVLGLADDPPAWFRFLEDPHAFFTPDRRRPAREEFRKMSGPIFLARGSEGPPVDMHNEFLIPDLKAAGQDVELITYPGQKHCFGFFATADRGVANDGDAAAGRFFADMHAFFKRHLPMQPQAVDDSLVTHVRVTSDQ